MNTNNDLQRQVTRVFADAAPTGYPDELLARVLTTTSRTRPRPTWLADLKEPPMRIPARVVVGSPTLRLASILALTLALILAAAGVVVAGASLLPSQPLPPPFGPARNGSLVYAKIGDIYLADADGSNSRPIITGDTADGPAWFSHDGRTIAFARGPAPNQALMVANADGSNVRQLLPAQEWNAEFMPSDQQMVATRTVDGHHVLSMIDVASGGVTDLDLGGIDPNFWQMPRPPDGREIIFTANTAPGNPEQGLYAIQPDGTGLRTIGALATAESYGKPPAPDRISFQTLALDPDGTTILYENWEPRDAAATASGDFLHLRDLDSGADLPLLFDPTDGGLMPHYSPDGSKVVFEGTTDGGNTQHLVYAPVDGSGPSVQIGPSYSYQDRLGNDFSPDGKQVVLSMNLYTLLIDAATDETIKIRDIQTTPYWQRLAP
jgi:dipeptidyl aminopeptidase/acylaminoacyl peptidase